jgi:hypothetical protein
MASVLNQLPNSSLSLQGNGFNPQTNQAAWGYIDASANLDPAASKLQNTYSVDSIPNVKLKNFNKNGVATVKAESRLDELDNNAPNLTPIGVVSQIYKSKQGRQYKQLGPQPGRY